MIVSVVAASNAPTMYRPPSTWAALRKVQLRGGVPAPAALHDEGPEQIAAHWARIGQAKLALKELLERVTPDALVTLCYDDGTCFNETQIPQFCTFLGTEVTGSAAVGALSEQPSSKVITAKCNPTVALDLQSELVEAGFDMSYMKEQNPQGRPSWGMTSALTWPCSEWVSNIPLVPIFINCSVEPTPSGKRCHAFGAALGRIAQDMPQRIAIAAIGGLSHDPLGPRSGWIDERLDKYVLENIARRRSHKLAQIFELDSDTLRNGTAQVRTWIAAAAAAEAANGQGAIIDYIPSYHGITGLGFAAWHFCK